MPTIAVAEMAYGIEKLAEGRRREDLLAALHRLVTEFADRLFDFNVKTAWAYGRILATARRAGRPMSVPDAAIAAIAKANGCALATRNVEDFATAGLEIVNPWQSESLAPAAAAGSGDRFRVRPCCASSSPGSGS